MKFCQLLTLFLSVITIAFTQDAGPDPKLMATLEQILCLGKTPLTEEQSASILTKCPCDKQSIMDEAIKTCLKATNLTESQRLTAWCGPEKKCIMDGFMAKVGNSKPVDANKGLEEKIKCIKTQLKI